MFVLGSFKLFSTESISKDLSPSDYAKTEKRLKELSSFLGILNKQSWSSQLTSRVIPSSLSTGPSSPLSTAIGSTHHHTLNGHPSNSQHFHSSNFTNSSAERIVSLHWNDVYKSLVVVLSNGLIASCFFHPAYLNCINYIYLDKYLIGKIKTEYMVDFIFDSRMILISYTNPRITCILLDDAKRSKNWASRKRKFFKLKSLNVKIIEHELDVNCGRRVERHLLKSEIKNDDEDLLIVWWQNGSNTICPWSSPISSSKDFCNILVYNLIHDSFDLVGYASILNDILKICFCKRRINRLMTVESEGDPCSILFREYQISLTDDCYVLDMIESIQLTVPCQVIKADINFELNKVILLCEDRSVLVYSIDQNCIRYFQAPINAIDIVNSPLDSYFIMSDSFGQIMMYDYGLHVMPANYDDLFLREAFTGLCEMKFLNNSLVYLRFTDDPNLMLIVLPPNLDYIGLIRSYVKHDYINEAIENVQLLNWNLNSYLAYSSLNVIFNNLLRTPLNTMKESQLQEALASFFIPKIPIAEDIIEEYQYEMHCIAKRFFYHLYRYSCLEKAFLLALDLKSRHLFLLLHKIAKERGNEKLAEVSLANAHKFNHSSHLHNVNNYTTMEKEKIDFSPKASSNPRILNEPSIYQMDSSLHEQQTTQMYNNNNSQNSNSHKLFDDNLLYYESGNLSNSYQVDQQQLTTFKPVRKESSSTHNSIPVYSSPRKRSEIVTTKVSKTGLNNAKIESQVVYQLSDIGGNDLHLFNPTDTQNPESSPLQMTYDSSSPTRQSFVPPPLPPARKEKICLPPPLPPKIRNKSKAVINSENVNIGHETGKYSDSSRTHDIPQHQLMTNPVDNPSSSLSRDLKINHLDDEPVNSMINEKEKQNIPLPINHLMKSHVNAQNPKIECIHYGLV